MAVAVDEQTPVRSPARAPVSLAVTLALLALFLAWAVHAGLPATSALTTTLAIVVTQVFPGVVLWRLVRPRDGWWVEDLAMGFGCGAALAIVAQLPAGYLNWWWLSGAVTLGVAAVVLAVPRSRRRVLTARTSSLPWWWSPLVTLTVFASVRQTQGYFRITPLTWASGARSLPNDTYLHLSLAGQLAHRGPTTFPWVQSEPLGYHYLAHAWIAQVGVTSGASLEDVLLRLMPVVVPVTIAFAVAAAALRLSALPWAGLVAAFLVMTPGMMNFFGITTSHYPMNPLSPTLGLSAPIMLVLVVLLALRWRGDAPRGTWPLVVVLAVVAAGTKGSTTPLLVAGAGVALVAMVIFDRSLLRRIGLDLVLLAVGMELAIRLVFRGSEAGLHRSLTDAAAQSWPGVYLPLDGRLSQLTVVFVAALGAVSVGLLGLVLAFRPWRADPVGWLLLGGGVAGAGAVAVFGHPGRSQWYFALNAIPLLVLASTLGLVAVVSALSRRALVTFGVCSVVGGLVATYGVPLVLGRIGVGTSLTRGLTYLVAGFAVLAVAALVAAAGTRGRRVFAAVATLGAAAIVSGAAMDVNVLRQAPPPPAAAVSVNYPWAATQGQLRAARWIRDHSGVDDVVMTNRHCSGARADPTNGCDSRRWLVAAYTERQVLLEGWTAVPKSAEIAPEGRASITVAYWKPGLLALNDGFIARPTAAAARELYAKGVRWVFVDDTRPHARTLEPFAAERFRARGVQVYQLEQG